VLLPLALLAVLVLVTFVSLSESQIAGDIRGMVFPFACEPCNYTMVTTSPYIGFKSVSDLSSAKKYESICNLSSTKSLPGTMWETISDIYSTYDEAPGLDHWAAYGPAYDQNIQHLREMALLEGRKVKMLEIGVSSGGSTRVWKRYFRGLTHYVGLDIEPRCRMFQSLEEGIRIITGSQLDTALLSKICKLYGPFDLVVDDGGHTNKMIQTSLKILWNCMKDGSVYVIEDLHSMNQGSPWYSKSEISVFQEISEWMRIRSPSIHDPTQIEMKNHPSRHLKQLAFSDSILFLHYGKNVSVLIDDRIKKGTYWKHGHQDLKKELSLSDWCDNCCIGCYEY